MCQCVTRVQFYRLSAGDQRVHGLDGEPAGGVGALQGGALRTAGLPRLNHRQTDGLQTRC